MQLIGKTATKLSVEAGDCDVPFEVDSITNRAALFKINIKHGETIMNDGAYGVTKVNCDPEMIAKYCGPHAENEVENTSKAATDKDAEKANLVDLTEESSSKKS